MDLFEGKNYFEILGISQDADKTEIKKAFYKLSREWHPDVCKHKDATEIFKLINQAYQTLIDDDEKKEYIEWLNSKDYDEDEEYDDEDWFDVTNFDTIMRSSYVTEEMLDDFTEDLTEEQLYFVFEYFWETFFIGKFLTEQMLKNKTVVTIFTYFINFDCIEEVPVGVFNEMNAEQRKVYKHNKKVYFDSVTNVTNSFVEALNMYETQEEIDVNRYNYMVDAITEDNVFDSGILYAIDYWEETIELLKWFETVAERGRENEDVLRRSSNDDLMSHKKINKAAAGGGGVVTVIFVIIIIWLVVKYL